MATVKVFTPNFKHITIKISPNMTLLQILEEASRRSELDPNLHDLKHHRTILDITQMFRFSGLPSNCELEMVAAKTPRRDDNDIGIVLQTESHGRFEGTFKPIDNLLEIIQQLCPEEADLATNPVIIYTRKDVHGADLESTTLKSLGLTSGRGMLRLVHKNREELKTQANVSANLPLKVAKPESDAEGPWKRKPVASQDNKTESDVEQAKPAKDNDLITNKSMESDDALPGCSKDSSHAPADVDLPEGPPAAAPKRHIEFTKEDLDRLERETHRLDDFNTVIYSLDSVISSSSEEVPDSFFDVTVRDIRVLMSHLKDYSKNIDNAPLMTTKLRELEDAKKTLIQLQYKETLIRVQFPNRLVLQTVFKPIDTIDSVKAFLKRYIHEDIQQYELFTTPPKTILNGEKRLVELHCVPQALIHFACEGHTEFIKQEFLEQLSTAPAADFLAAKIRGRIEMVENNGKSPEIATDDPMDEDETRADLPPKQRIIGTFKVSSTAAAADKGSMPKWFKPSK